MHVDEYKNEQNIVSKVGIFELISDDIFLNILD